MATLCFMVMVVVGGCAAMHVSRAFDRAFLQLGSYSAGPRPYPDQDPAA